MSIKSEYIRNILELICDDNNEAIIANNQIKYLTESNFDYTGVGVFVNFEYDDRIQEYKINNKDLIIGGVIITSKKHSIEAMADIFFKDGIIDSLEIWCYNGGDYPSKDLDEYTLKQSWNNSPEKIITTENNSK